MSYCKCLALVCFLCAAILAATYARYSSRTGGLWWGTLLCLGLALWLLSQMALIK